MTTEHNTVEDYYTRGLVAGNRRIFYLTEEAARQSMATAEDMVMFYGEMHMDRLAAYYSGIRDVLGDYFEALEERIESELDVAEELGLSWWERILVRIPPAAVAVVAFAAIVAVLYWKGPDF